MKMNMLRSFVLATVVLSTGTLLAGLYEQIASSSVCSVSSPVFMDAPLSVGVVPSVCPAEKMGFFVDTVSITGSIVTVAWKTDVEPPYDARYVFDKPVGGSLVTLRNMTDKRFSCQLPEGARLMHIEVGVANGLVDENVRRTVERQRAFCVPGYVVGEMYYDVLSRRTSPYKGASYIYPADQKGEPFRAMLFSLTKNFQYQISIPQSNGGQIVVSSVYEDPNDDSLIYGVGYRMTCSTDSTLTFVRAYSANPNRSDAKIVRIR